MEQETLSEAVASRGGLLWHDAGVVVPEEIEAALREDRLVFFVGAGVSVPSGLPSFRDLAIQVAEMLGRRDLIPDDPAAAVRFDVVMGELDRIEGSVHAAVRQRIGIEAQPNSYHRDILRIATSYGARPKIVTTNFDRLFEATADRQSLVTWNAPALPRGDNFSGLVHLHGTDVDDGPGSQLIVTDADFGAAYITEGWATDFVARLFGSSTVLFLGYSAEDTIMQYLARALPDGDGRRFALTIDSDATVIARWRQLGVEPLLFPDGGDDDRYGAMGRFLSAYADRLTATTATTHDHMRGIAEKGPEAAPENLGWLIADPHNAQFFRMHAKPADWASDPTVVSAVRHRFDSARTRHEAEDGWGDWLTRTIASPDDESFLAFAAATGGGLDGGLWFYLFFQLRTNFENTPRDHQLLFLLLANRRSGDAGRLGLLLGPVAQKSPAAAEQLLRELLRPQFQLGTRLALPFGPHLQTNLTPTLDPHTTNDGWAQLRPHLANRELFLGMLLDVIAAIESADQLNRVAGSMAGSVLGRWAFDIRGERGWLTQTPETVLLKIARETFADVVAESGSAAAFRAITSGQGIARRLGLNALFDNPEDLHDVLRLILSENLLSDFTASAEVRRVLPLAYRAAAVSDREVFVEEALRVASDPEDAYTNVRRLTALERVRALGKGGVNELPDTDPLVTAIARLRADDPDLPAEIESDDGYSEIGVLPHDHLTPTGRFQAFTPAEVAAQVAASNARYDGFDYDQTLADMVGFIQASTATRANDLLAALRTSGIASPFVWAIAIDAALDLPAISAADVIAQFADARMDIRELADAVSVRLFWRGSDYTTVNIPERLSLTRWLWEQTPATDTSEPRTSTSTVETPRDNLTMQWVRQTIDDALNSNMVQYSQEQRATLEMFVDATLHDERDPSGFWVFRRADVLRRLDATWFDEKLLPHLDEIEENPAARVLWAGLGEAGIGGDFAAKTAPLLRNKAHSATARLGSDARPVLQLHAFYFAATTIGTDSADWPTPFMARASPSQRVDWIRTIANEFNERPAPTKLYDWWETRTLDGTVTPAEQRALVSWILLPGTDVERATQLFVAGPDLDPENDYDIYAGMDEITDLILDTPDAFIDIAHKLLVNASHPPAFTTALMETLKARPNHPKTAKIWGRLLELGVAEARDQLV